MAGMSAQDRSATLARAGVSQGLIDLFNETSELQAKQLADAREFNRVTALAVTNAENLKSAAAALDQSLASAGTRMLDLLSPTAASGLNLLADKIGGASAAKTNEDSRQFWGGASQQERQLAAYNKYGDALPKVAAGNALGGALADLIQDAPNSRAARNNNPGNIKAVEDQRRDAQGFRIFATLAEGVEAMQKNVERRVSEGYDTITKLIAAYEGTDTQKDPKATAAYIARVARTTGLDANATITADELPAILAAMTRQEAGLKDSRGGTPRGATPNAGAASTNTSNATSNNTTVTAPITINPPAGADPAAIANQTASALNRKITVAQANAGQS